MEYGIWSGSILSTCHPAVFIQINSYLKTLFIQEMFNKLTYGINTIIKCGTWQPVKFQLVSLSGNEMIFIVSINSEIWYKTISFLIQFKNKRLTEILQAVRAQLFKANDVVS